MPFDPSIFTLNPLRELEGIESTPQFQELVASFRARIALGLPANAEPVLYYESGDQLIVESGHCRVLAAKIVGCQVQASKIDPPKDEASGILEQLTINMLRAELNPMDQAIAFARLQNEFKMSGDDIAKYLGKSGTYVSMILGLLNLAPALQDRVRRGELGYRAAYEMSVLHPKTQEQKMPQLKAVKTVREVKEVKAQVMAEQVMAEKQLTLPGLEPPIVQPQELPKDKAFMEQVAALTNLAVTSIKEARRITEEHGVSLDITEILDACK